MCASSVPQDKYPFLIGVGGIRDDYGTVIARTYEGGLRLPISEQKWSRQNAHKVIYET